MSGSIYAKGVNKTLTIAPETTYGVQSTAAGQILRRVQCTMTPTTQLTPSQEILQSQQVRDARQGPRQINGTLSGQLSPTTYSLLFECLLRNQFGGGAGFTGLTDLQISAGGPPSFRSASTNFSTKFKVGDIVRVAGASVDNGLNLRIIAIGGTGQQCNVQPVTGLAFQAPGAGSVSLRGRKLLVPPTNQLFPSFTLEEWYSDTGVSDVTLGCVITQMQIQMPARGFCTFSATFLGQNQIETSTQVYTVDAPATTTPSLAMLGGSMSYQGNSLAYVSNATLSISSTVQADPMIGSNIIPAIFLGTLSETGSFSTLMTSDTLTNDFLQENEVDLGFNLVTANSPTADFMQFYMPRVKLSAAAKTDSDRAISRNFSFQALENTGSNVNADLTSIVLQDSLQAAAV